MLVGGWKSEAELGSHWSPLYLGCSTVSILRDLVC